MSERSEKVGAAIIEALRQCGTISQSTEEIVAALAYCSDTDVEKLKLLLGNAALQASARDRIGA